MKNNDEALLDFLFKFVETDPSFKLRQHILQHMSKHPPFKLNSEESPLNTESLVNKLWKLLRYFLNFDFFYFFDLFLASRTRVFGL